MPKIIVNNIRLTQQASGGKGILGGIGFGGKCEAHVHIPGPTVEDWEEWFAGIQVCTARAVVLLSRPNSTIVAFPNIADRGFKTSVREIQGRIDELCEGIRNDEVTLRVLGQIRKDVLNKAGQSLSPDVTLLCKVNPIEMVTIVRSRLSPLRDSNGNIPRGLLGPMVQLLEATACPVHEVKMDEVGRQISVSTYFRQITDERR